MMEVLLSTQNLHSLPGTSQIPTHWAIAVVIPCFKVEKKILDVLKQIGPEVQKIYVVDDKCPQRSGHFVNTQTSDPRVQVIYHKENQGVGGATLTGYKKALEDQMDIIVKVDGDGQMDPALIPYFVYPIIQGEADYTKGNRFYSLDSFQSMPLIRKVGNLGLSFLTKLSSGYWHTFDPTNGYTACHLKVARLLDMEKISKRYFFESDMLFRLNLVGASVVDVPMKARYEDEVSNLSVSREFFNFFFKNLKNLSKRWIYNYFLRDFNIASLSLVLGLILIGFGLIYGIYQFVTLGTQGQVATAGTVMLAALPIIIGTQLFLTFLNFDMSRVPQTPLHKKIP